MFKKSPIPSDATSATSGSTLKPSSGEVHSDDALSPVRQICLLSSSSVRSFDIKTSQRTDPITPRGDNADDGPRCERCQKVKAKTRVQLPGDAKKMLLCRKCKCLFVLSSFVIVVDVVGPQARFS